MDQPKHPANKTITVKAKTKKRFSVIVDASLLSLMTAVGRKIDAPRRVPNEDGLALDGVYLLPTNNVLEAFVDAEGKPRGYLFNNLDVWISYGQTEDAS
jgi:hypothetical protein